MSTLPINPVFDKIPAPPPAPSTSAATPDQTIGGSPIDEDVAVQSANAEIEAVSSAIKELQERLDRANSQMGQVAAVRTTEIEIGRLFVEAQKFTDTALSNLEQQVLSILHRADAKAQEIIREATDEADEIRRQAQQSLAIPTQTAQDLQAAIAGFSNVNSELIKELSVLNVMLTPPTQPGIRQSESSDPAIGPT
jgi:chromosome segregation ATPase